MLTCSPRPGNKGLEATLTFRRNLPMDKTVQCLPRMGLPIHSRDLSEDSIR